MIWTAVLGLGFIFALAGDFVLWAKVDELKQTVNDEHANYLAALRLHNDAAEELGQCKARERCSAKSVLWYANEITKLYACLDAEVEYADNVIDEKRKLQDRLSAILCPRRNHIWIDGVCKRCGRAKDATD